MSANNRKEDSRMQLDERKWKILLGDHQDVSGDGRTGWFEDDLKYADLNLSSATIRK